MNGIISAVLFFGGIALCADDGDWAGVAMGLIGILVFSALGLWN